MLHTNAINKKYLKLNNIIASYKIFINRLTVVISVMLFLMNCLTALFNFNFLLIFSFTFKLNLKNPSTYWSCIDMKAIKNIVDFITLEYILHVFLLPRWFSTKVYSAYQTFKFVLTLLTFCTLLRLFMKEYSVYKYMYLISSYSIYQVNEFC